MNARKKISSILAELSEDEKEFLAQLSDEEDVELDEEIEEDIEENNEEEIYEEETELAEEERHRKKKEDYTPTQV